jgi:simple sugar transport system ATP-binding protein
LEARNRGLGVIFITHNPNHAYPVGDRFLILNRGKSMGNFAKDEITRDELIMMMAGGAELEELTKELESAAGGDESLAHLAEEFAEEFHELEERAEDDHH